MPQQRDLRIRMRGEDVAQLQNALRQLNFPVEDNEDTFARRTKEAVVRFQRKIGLEPTGIVDQVTAGWLREALNRRTSVQQELEQLMNDIRETVEGIELLDPQDTDVQAKIESLTRDMHTHTQVLESLRRRGAPDRMVSGIEQMLCAGMAKLRELGPFSIMHRPSRNVRRRR